jgi:feruloyl esterase
MGFMSYNIVALLAAATYLLGPVRAVDEFQRTCLAFKPESYIKNSTRTILEYIPAGTNLMFPWSDTTCGRPSQVVGADLCRIALSIPTSNRSSVTFELWLPRNWTGRFLGTGNGGIDGCGCSSIFSLAIADQAIGVKY